MAIISGGMKGGTRPTDLGKSTMKNTPVGSGSRPTPSRYKIETSEPENARTLDRDPPQWLK
jgi:hypothetical protein